MKRVVLCDIDHTVADAFWRDPMIGGEGGWDAYHEAGREDAPVEEMVDLVRALHASGFEVVGLTARPEKWRSLSMKWLTEHGVKFSDLIMRPDGDFRRSPEVKLAVAKERWPDLKGSVAFLIEDRDDVCAVFRAEGVTVLQCHLYPTPAPSIPFEIETNIKGVK